MKQWQPYIKPTLLIDIYRLPDKETQQVFSKIGMLLQDPLPDGKAKKQLKYLNRDIYRLRSGRYRLFYTLNERTINILTLRRRNEATYKDDFDFAHDLDADELDDLADLDELDLGGTTSSGPDWERIFSSQAQPQAEPLPEPITVELLKRCNVPERYHAQLLRVTDRDTLYACEKSVPVEALLRLDEYLFERPLHQILDQPDLVLNDVDDLLRYREGELITFLLKLSPEQEKYTRWPLEASGPALVKGGPGTGKSTVALYRVRSLLEQLLKAGKAAPRVLFTTYTNALVKASEQQLQQLLGAQASYVQVDTADKLAYAILQESHATREIIEDAELRQLTRRAIAETVFPGGALQQAAQRQTIQRMGLDYLLQEFNAVMVARQISDLSAYLSTSRAGRQMRLSAMQRRAVWLVYEVWSKLLLASNKETWQQRRARSCALVEQSALY